MIEPTSNSAQRHWGIQPMRGEGERFGPNSGPRPPGTGRYQVGLSGLTALSNVRSLGAKRKTYPPIELFRQTPERTCDHRRLDRQVCLRAALRLSRGWD